jgi:nitroreductase
LRVVPVPAAGRARCLAALSPAGPPDAALASAPVLVAPCLEAGDPEDPRGGRAGAASPPPAEATGLAAGGAVRTLLLALHAHGLAAAFVAAGGAAGAALATALGLPPDARPLGLLAAGRPDPGTAAGR